MRKNLWGIFSIITGMTTIKIITVMKVMMMMQEGKSVDRIVLNEAATGGISGSKLSPDEDELEVIMIIIMMMMMVMVDDGDVGDDGDVIVAGEDRLQGSEVRRREREGDQRTSGFYLLSLSLPLFIFLSF